MTHKALAIDAMSGDFGPRVTIPATLQFLQDTPNAKIMLVGDEQVLKPLIKPRFASRIDIVHADEVVAMDESPKTARNKKKSSMRIAIDLVGNHDASACISAGNTAALMLISKYVLKMIEGVDRPAICGAVPNLGGHSYLLDMGANVDCEAQHLLQFAQMANVFVQCADEISNPTIALLNNGEEDTKGNSQVREAARLLEAAKNINYIGYVEGHKIYQAAADVIVCDGFVGNVALKASEGVATYIIEKIKAEISADPLSRILSLFAIPEFRRIKAKIDPRRLNGACLLGLKGVVIKSHGHADELAFLYAIKQAYQISSKNIISQLDTYFSAVHS